VYELYKGRAANGYGEKEELQRLKEERVTERQ
jgi:hypothetical protein